MKEGKRGGFLCITALFLPVVCVSSGKEYTNSSGEEGSEEEEKVR